MATKAIFNVDGTHQVEAVSTGRDAMIDALKECEEYFSDRMDADCDQDGYIPNKEMRMFAMVQDALEKAGV